MTNSLLKVLITGAQGQLGNALQHHVDANKFTLIPCSHADLDITQNQSIANAIKKFSPDIIINSAAYTAVDKAEQETDLAFSINHMGAKNLAIICESHQIPLIHISTDYIFNGEKSHPYLEDDAASPINVYGQSKWLGEEAVRNECEKHIILRISGVFSEYNQNFMKTMLRLAKERKELRVVADQITCPTYAVDIAGAIFKMINNQKHWGTYHYCSAEPTSWFEFASAIIDEAKQTQSLLVEEVKAITTAEFPTPAKRPAYSVMDCQKMKNHFDIAQPSWRLGIKRVLATH